MFFGILVLRIKFCWNLEVDLRIQNWECQQDVLSMIYLFNLYVLDLLSSDIAEIRVAYFRRTGMHVSLFFFFLYNGKPI